VIRVNTVSGLVYCFIRVEELELYNMRYTPTAWLSPEIVFTCCALATVVIGIGPRGGGLGIDLNSLFGYFELT
jgi:hypothetical protein